jgi:hypothetical protein
LKKGPREDMDHPSKGHVEVVGVYSYKMTLIMEIEEIISTIDLDLHREV